MKTSARLIESKDEKYTQKQMVKDLKPWEGVSLFPAFWKRKLRSDKIYSESTGHNGNSCPTATTHKLHCACRHGVGTKPQEMLWPVVAVTSRKGKIRKTI